MDFSLAEAVLMASSGKATSISFFLIFIPSCRLPTLS